jgi:hypothetical protein
MFKSAEPEIKRLTTRREKTIAMAIAASLIAVSARFAVCAGMVPCGAAQRKL